MPGKSVPLTLSGSSGSSGMSASAIANAAACPMPYAYVIGITNAFLQLNLGCTAPRVIVPRELCTVVFDRQRVMPI